jgi:hypothetical protein
MQLTEGLIKLWESTGLYNIVAPADPTITNTTEQFLHQFGNPIMLLICLGF